MEKQAKTTGEKLLIVLFFTLILSVMNATMFNVALPDIRTEFDLTSAEVGWVLSGFIVVYAIGSVTYGKLADQFPLKKLLTFGLLVLAVGSLFGLFATSFWMVMVGRVLQSIGASVIPAVAMLIPVRYFPAERRGRALGVVATGLATGTAIGPIVAGIIASQLDWRYLFVLPMLLVGVLPFYRKYLTEGELSRAKMDWLGGGLLAATIVSLLLAITKSNWTLFVVGIVLLGLLVIQVRRVAHPFLAKSLFANHAFVFTLLMAFLSTGLIFVVPFTIPLLLHDIQGLQAGAIGLVLAPGAVIAALVGRRVGRIVDEQGNAFVFTIAAVMMVGAFLALSQFVASTPVLVASLLVLTSVGQVGVQISMSNKISATLPRETVGLGMGMFAMMNFISGALATTLIGKIVALQDTQATFSNIFLGLAILLVVILSIYSIGNKKLKL